MTGDPTAEFEPVARAASMSKRVPTGIEPPALDQFPTIVTAPSGS